MRLFIKSCPELLDHYSHNANKLVSSLPSNVPKKLKDRHPSQLTIDYFKVDLRYAIESYWFRDANEESNYSTVSDDKWMGELESLTEDYIGWFIKLKNGADSMKSSTVSLEELTTVEYNPYRNQNS